MKPSPLVRIVAQTPLPDFFFLTVGGKRKFVVKQALNVASGERLVSFALAVLNADSADAEIRQNSSLLRRIKSCKKTSRFRTFLNC